MSVDENQEIHGCFVSGPTVRLVGNSRPGRIGNHTPCIPDWPGRRWLERQEITGEAKLR
jgi:hypothetical protein